MSNGEETNEEEVLLEDYLTEDSEDVVEEVPSALKLVIPFRVFFLLKFI